jgi:hypothetical protein
MRGTSANWASDTLLFAEELWFYCSNWSHVWILQSRCWKRTSRNSGISNVWINGPQGHPGNLFEVTDWYCFSASAFWAIWLYKVIWLALFLSVGTDVNVMWSDVWNFFFFRILLGYYLDYSTFRLRFIECHTLRYPPAKMFDKPSRIIRMYTQPCMAKGIQFTRERNGHCQPFNPISRTILLIIPEQNAEKSMNQECLNHSSNVKMIEITFLTLVTHYYSNETLTMGQRIGPTENH